MTKLTTNYFHADRKAFGSSSDNVSVGPYHPTALQLCVQAIEDDNGQLKARCSIVKCVGASAFGASDEIPSGECFILFDANCYVSPKVGETVRAVLRDGFGMDAIGFACLKQKQSCIDHIVLKANHDIIVFVDGSTARRDRFGNISGAASATHKRVAERSNCG